ncbi:S1C family serine protease [Tropheryma whipplei]|uniref:Putative serine protease n=1 Tax=Tropheryma whipplei (strain Twist) TaxID=203267 RepID=Q83FS8_TROWT|nr:trypsin-like peptidase domain-containing protein [Tropheryma whipplei]AAO44722.1 putative serine protease [Tropheryma whipplei str. Twist]
MGDELENVTGSDATDEVLATARRIAVSSGKGNFKVPKLRQKLKLVAKKMKPKCILHKYVWFALVIVAVAFLSGFTSSVVTYRLLSSDQQKESPLLPLTPPIYSSGTKELDLPSATAKRVISSVVTIQVSAGNGMSGSGSGVVFNDNGDIVTNAHVVTLDGRVDKPDLRVLARDGRRYKAVLVGVDRMLDIAVVRIKPRALPAITFGDSSAVTVGSSVIAVGAPLGYDFSVTRGIISSVLRSINLTSFGLAGQVNAVPVIQTDAAINPGNSGGPLVDLNGRLIGINVAIASAGLFSSGNVGVGFAIPSNLVHRVATALAANRPVSHGYLGVSVSDGSDRDESYEGAVVKSVTPGSPADTAGLKPGDLLLSIGGNKISNMIDLVAFVRSRPGGTPVPIRVERNGKEISLTVTLSSLEEIKGT